MFALDPRSIIFVLLLVNTGLAIQLVLAARRRPGDVSMRWWSGAAFQGVFGILLFVGRGVLPDWVSIWLANVVIASTYLTVWLGLSAFDGRPVKLREAVAMLAAYAAAFGVMYIEGAGFAARVNFLSFANAFLCALTVRDLARDRSLPTRVFATFLLGAQTTLFVVRALSTWFVPPGEDLMNPDRLQVFYLVLQVFISPLWIVALLAMTGERAQALLAAALAEQQNASDAKSEFLRRLAHEVRTPLGAVAGFADLIRETTTNEQTRTQAGHILTAAGHVVELSDELLDLARIEARKVTMEPRDVDVATALHEALAILRAPLETRRIRVALHTPVPLRLHADPRHLRQILINVLGNAAKFGREDGHVEVRVGRDETGADIVISDDGPGISGVEPASLFEPFARGAGSTGVEGSGLGLPIVKGLVEAHGGTAAIESAPGRGTTIRLHFPQERVRQG
jgi:signal transduction histidine kinase